MGVPVLTGPLRQLRLVEAGVAGQLGKHVDLADVQPLDEERFQAVTERLKLGHP
jgi:hypothetical protein